MDLASVPKYSDLFDGPVPSLESLLDGIPSNLVIELGCAINAELHLGRGKDSSDKRILEIFMLRQDLATQKKISSRLQAFFNNGSFGLFAPTYIHALLHYVLCNFQAIEIDDTTPAQELQLFKAYLIIAERENKAIEDQYERNSIYEGEFFHKFTWPLMGKQFLEGKTINPLREMVRGIVFLNYFQRNQKLNKYVKRFLELKKRQTAWNYIFDILNIIKESWKPAEKGIFSGHRFKIAMVEDFEAMFEPISIDIEAYSTEAGTQIIPFTSIRAKPLIRLDGVYFVLDWNALAGKLYEGLIYEFYHLSGISSEAGYLTFPDFKNKVASEISEKFLFERLLRKIFDKKHSVLEFDLGIKGHPDAYFRQGNDIILFEIKDSYFSAKAIASADFMEIKTEIDKKYNNEKKGLGQFIKQLKHLQENSFERLKRYGHNRNLRIYPVLLYTDYMFGMPGTNDYLQREFKRLLKENNLEGSFRQIKPVTLINLGFFIDNVNILGDKDLSMTALLDRYQLALQRADKKAARSREDLSLFFQVYQNFDYVIQKEYPNKFVKREDYVTSIVQALDLTEGLPNP